MIVLWLEIDSSVRLQKPDLSAFQAHCKASFRRLGREFMYREGAFVCILWVEFSGVWMLVTRESAEVLARQKDNPSDFGVNVMLCMFKH